MDHLFCKVKLYEYIKINIIVLLKFLLLLLSMKLKGFLKIAMMFRSILRKDV